jgi:hypothetical protein
MVSVISGAREGACGSGFVRSNSAPAGVWTRGQECWVPRHLPVLLPRWGPSRAFMIGARGSGASAQKVTPAMQYIMRCGAGSGLAHPRASGDGTRTSALAPPGQPGAANGPGAFTP